MVQRITPEQRARLDALVTTLTNQQPQIVDDVPPDCILAIQFNQPMEQALDPANEVHVVETCQFVREEFFQLLGEHRTTIETKFAAAKAEGFNMAVALFAGNGLITLRYKVVGARWVQGGLA